MAIRVLYVCPVGERGGAERALLNILRHHDRTRVEPLVCFLKEGPLVDEVRDLGVRTFVVPTTRFRHARGTVAAIRRIRRLLRQERVDVVFGNLPMAHLYGGLASLGTATRRAWYQHGAASRADVVDWLAALLPAERLYVNSATSLRAQERLYNRVRRTQLLYYGLDLPPAYEPAAAKARLALEFGLHADGPLIAMVGRLQRGKGQHVLVDAAAAIHLVDGSARFLIVGDTQFGLEPEYKRALQNRIDTAGLSQHVILTGFRNDVPSILAAVDVVAFPVIAPESFGFAVAEAMLAAKPVVASNQGGPAEIVDDGETGFLVPPGDSRALAHRILQLLRDRRLRDEIGRRAQASVRERFTMPRMMAELESSFAEIMGSPAS